MAFASSKIVVNPGSQHAKGIKEFLLLNSCLHLVTPRVLFTTLFSQTIKKLLIKTGKLEITLYFLLDVIEIQRWFLFCCFWTAGMRCSKPIVKEYLSAQKIKRNQQLFKLKRNDSKANQKVGISIQVQWNNSSFPCGLCGLYVWFLHMLTHSDGHYKQVHRHKSFWWQWDLARWNGNF